jgi:hypothetical protein
MAPPNRGRPRCPGCIGHPTEPYRLPRYYSRRRRPQRHLDVPPTGRRWPSGCAWWRRFGVPSPCNSPGPYTGGHRRIPALSPVRGGPDAADRPIGSPCPRFALLHVGGLTVGDVRYGTVDVLLSARRDGLSYRPNKRPGAFPSRVGPARGRRVHGAVGGRECAWPTATCAMAANKARLDCQSRRVSRRGPTASQGRHAKAGTSCWPNPPTDSARRTAQTKSRRSTH